MFCNCFAIYIFVIKTVNRLNSDNDLYLSVSGRSLRKYNMSIVLKIISSVLKLFRVNGEINYVSLALVAGVIPLLVWFAVKKLTSTKKGRNPFAQDTRRPPEPLETDLKARDKVLKNGFVIKKVPDNLDVIFIGSGIGSLSCAALLAKAGKKVLVLEQHDQAGGCCHTFYEKGIFHLLEIRTTAQPCLHSHCKMCIYGSSYFSHCSGCRVNHWD